MSIRKKDQLYNGITIIEKYLFFLAFRYSETLEFNAHQIETNRIEIKTNRIETKSIESKRKHGKISLYT